ncbi:MAG: bifunctional riboflavin kinase/FAD synthetase [Ignavibacteriae bacterium]|nr:MAG: bifunctional riboflavin kinase/FAD synthetase [Ignavibacteriota bacterium]
MIVIRYGQDALPYDKNTVLTVGTFDGVHCGHRGIITRMLEASIVHRPSSIADQRTPDDRRRTVVVTFDPHPQIVLQKPEREPVKLLSTIDERCEVFEQLGIDMVVVIPFTREFGATPAEQFIRDVIVNGIGVSHFLVGHDHMFGKDRGGDETLLQRLGPECGFSVEIMPPLVCGEIVVSSTKVRNALKDGQVEEAEKMLGRPYSLKGRVVRGDERGRTIGFPTANIAPIDEHKLMPGTGVYLVTTVIDGVERVGMANIGVRPTFTTDTVPTLEVHYLDVDADLYDRELTVFFRRFLRAEQRFDSKEALLAQLLDDRNHATEFQFTFNHRSTS